MRSESRRNGLTCCGWCAARHASINPSYLTEGYKSTGNNQTTGQNPTVHKGFSPYPACVNKALKVDIRFFRQEGFSLNEETWVRDIKEKREVYGISQQKLALAAGITRPYLSDIETGKAHPSEALQEAITEALERFNPDNPLEMLFDYVRIRFPTTDVKHIVEDVLRLKLPYFIHEDYGYTTMELLSVAMLIVISTFALDFIHTDRSVFKIVDLDEAWSFLQVAQGKTLSMKLVRAGRAMNAGVYFVTQNTDDLLDEKLKNNLGLKFAFRSTDINEIKKTLAFFGVDSEDENNQKRLRDLENGQCLISDLYGRVGVIQFHPIFEDLFHAFDTRPPVRKEVE